MSRFTDEIEDLERRAAESEARGERADYLGLVISGLRAGLDGRSTHPTEPTGEAIAAGLAEGKVTRTRLQERAGIRAHLDRLGVVYAVGDSPAGLASRLAEEVERLRAAVIALKDQADDVAVRAEGDERAAIVAWLKHVASGLSGAQAYSRIERGEHLLWQRAVREANEADARARPKDRHVWTCTGCGSDVWGSISDDQEREEILDATGPHRCMAPPTPKPPRDFALDAPPLTDDELFQLRRLLRSSEIKRIV